MAVNIRRDTAGTVIVTWAPQSNYMYCNLSEYELTHHSTLMEQTRVTFPYILVHSLFLFA